MPMCTTSPPGVAVLDRDRPDAGDIGRLVLPCDGRCQKREGEQGRSGMMVRRVELYRPRPAAIAPINAPRELRSAT
jgi:hypothetical protein